ncbi:MAG TPA: acyl-CoA synthase, partial [Ramlibacter sp.]|nr:acyl-CoA synthase [Ramlibacter sp.]
VPAAFVTLKPGTQADGADVLAQVAPRVYERPAVPKRVVVLDVLPTTAVGKVYKPALRLKATELKLQEVFAAAAPGVPVHVVAKENGAGCVAEVTVGGAADARLEQRLREALGAIAVETVFRFG